MIRDMEQDSAWETAFRGLEEGAAFPEMGQGYWHLQPGHSAVPPSCQWEGPWPDLPSLTIQATPATVMV